MPDYSVGNAPAGASYAAPLQGFAFGQALANLPDEYFKGTQQARQLALQKPILDPATGQPSQDASVVAQELMMRGGAEYAKELLPFLQKQPFFNKLLQEDEGGGAPQTYPPPLARTNNNAGGPQYAPPQRPVGAPGEGEGDTINSVVAGVMGGKPFPAAGIFSIARQLGVNPSADLTPQQVAQVKGFLGSSALPAGSRVAANQETNQSNVENSAQEVNGNAARANFAEGVSGGAAPIQAPLGPKVVRTQSVINPQTQEALKGLVPDEYLSNPRAWVEGQRRRADAIRRRSHLEGIVGIPSKAGEDQAAAIDKKIQSVEELIGKVQTPTGTMQEARDPAVQRFEGQKLAQKQELTRGDALQKGIQGSAREFETALKPHLDAMRGIMNNPNFVSGTGEGLLTSLNKIRSNPLFQHLPGYDPNAALPNEAIRKVVSASILNQTTQLKDEAAEIGGTAGRLFQQQISLMEKAAQNPDATLPALRYLTELQQRMGDHSSAVAKLANDYNGKYGKGVLDNGFNDVLAKYNSDPKHQIFKPEEIADMRRFAPPVAPRLDTEAQAKAFARQAGLKPGDPMKLPSGRIVPAP